MPEPGSPLRPFDALVHAIGQAHFASFNQHLNRRLGPGQLIARLPEHVRAGLREATSADLARIRVEPYELPERR